MFISCIPWVVQVTFTSFDEHDLEIVIQVCQSSSHHAPVDGQSSSPDSIEHAYGIPARTSTTHNDIDFIGNRHGVTACCRLRVFFRKMLGSQ